MGFCLDRAGEGAEACGIFNC